MRELIAALLLGTTVVMIPGPQCPSCQTAGEGGVTLTPVVVITPPAPINE